MRRKIVMQPLGNIAVCRPQKVSSSTCNRPHQTQSGVSGSHVDGYVLEADTSVGGAERHVAEMMINGAISFDDAAQALDQLWQ
jgi:hypothetical protein